MCKLLDKVQPKNKEQLKQLIDYAFKHNIYDLNFIDTSKITDMSGLFICIAHDFDVSSWDVSNAKNISYIFYKCKNFTGKGIENWDVSNIYNTSNMFKGCKNFKCKGLENWNLKLKNIKFYYHMFYDCDKNIIPNWYKKYNFK